MLSVVAVIATDVVPARVAELQRDELTVVVGTPDSVPVPCASSFDGTSSGSNDFS